MCHLRAWSRITARLGRGSIVLMLALSGLSAPRGQAWADGPAATPTPVRARLDWRAASQTALAPPSVTAASAHNFPALADAEVHQGHASQNFGILPYVGAGYDADNGLLAYRALFDFGVTQFLPPGTTIQSAALKIYLAGFCYYGADSIANLQVRRLAGPWSEMAVTWNTQPGLAEGYGAAGVDDAYQTWRSFDVTALVQGWVNGTQPEYGLALVGPETSPYGCASRDFFSRGAGYAYTPYLQITYSLPAPALIGAAAPLTFYHQCGVGAPAPAAKTIPIQSNSAALANWTASPQGGQGWLSLNTSAGKVSTLFPDEIQVSVAEAGPCPGTQTAHIQVSAAGLGGGYTVDVSLVQSVQAPSALFLPLLGKSAGGPANAPAALAPAATGRYALVVGVSDYLYLSPPTLSPFHSGVWDDGRDLVYSAADLVEPARHFENSGYHTTRLQGENATYQNIVYWFQWLKKRLGLISAASAGTQADVVIYFSGHGGPLVPDQPPLDEADGDDEFLATYDTQAAPFANYILDDYLQTLLADLGNEHVAVIADACNSGGLDVIQPNHALLAATLENQNSWESGELEHGVFTYFMLQAMQNPASDTNQDGWLSLGEIQAYAQPLITQYLNSKSLTLQTIRFAPNSTGDLNIVQFP